MTVDLFPDELALARAQLASGLFGTAEGTVRSRIRILSATSRPGEELDVARLLLAEALWRQGRIAAAGVSVSEIRPRSPSRRKPLALMIEAEALAAQGLADRAQPLVAEVVGAIGADGAWSLRQGTPTRLAWPHPPALDDSPPPPPLAVAGEPAVRAEAARTRLLAAKRAFADGDPESGDRELAMAVRLDASTSAEGLALFEPTLGPRPASDRLLLYGDLLRTAGRDTEASAIFDRAAKPEPE